VFRDVQDGTEEANRLTLVVAFDDFFPAAAPFPLTGLASGQELHIQILKPSRIAIIK